MITTCPTCQERWNIDHLTDIERNDMYTGNGCPACSGCPTEPTQPDTVKENTMTTKTTNPRTDRFEVQTYMYPGHWENCWHEENDTLQTFDTRADAHDALVDHLNACKDAHMDYDANDFRIVLQNAPYQYSVPQDVVEYAHLSGLDPICTGGGFDYMTIPLDPGNNDIILADALDAGSPESLDAPAEVLLMTDEWQTSARLFHGTAKECIDFMARIEVYNRINR